MLRNLIQRAKASLVYRLLVGRLLNRRYFKEAARVIRRHLVAGLTRSGLQIESVNSN
jgi:hypothetical protein